MDKWEALRKDINDRRKWTIDRVEQIGDHISINQLNHFKSKIKAYDGILHRMDELEGM